jgi:3-phenylpropionate/trans-cinnamate dioxygenase ferredoxin reductase subunit
MPERIVVVGGGLAGGSAVVALREQGYDGRLTVVTNEPHLPYERPPLSKGYLAGSTELGELLVKPQEWYVDHDVEVVTGRPARGVDLGSRAVAVDGDELGFDKLLLATGSSARRIPALEASGAPVAYLRTIDDSDLLRAAIEHRERLVVVGGGWIGLEVAATARSAGCEVTVVEMLDVPLQRVLGTEVGSVFGRLHRDHGVDLRTGVSVEAVDRDGEGASVSLGDGSTVAADLVVVGAGATPNLDLARGAGLSVEDGVLTDAHLRTSHPDVYAAGDIASAEHPRLGRRVRVEHWDNAAEQGKAAAANMLGAGQPYDRLPYFYTDQYDLGMEYVGHVQPGDADEVVVRGDVEGFVFTAFWARDGRVIAGMQVNDWDAMDGVRDVVESGAAVAAIDHLLRQ